MTEREQIRIDIKRKLNSYRELSAEHQQLADELARMETLLGAPAIPNMDGMPKGTTVSNPVERWALKHLELQQRYWDQIDDLVAGQAEIESLIETLEPTERRLARFRYIDGLTWENVCDRMCYSWRQTHRIHGRMLDKLVAAEMEKQLRS